MHSRLTVADEGEIYVAEDLAIGNPVGDPISTLNLAGGPHWARSAYLAADGDESGRVDAADYGMWKANFGRTLPSTDRSITVATGGAIRTTVNFELATHVAAPFCRSGK